MFTIGAFARLAAVSTRTLRFYDEVGLLPPAATDAATGYRLYRASQLSRLHRILVLKELGVSLDELAPLLDEGVDVALLTAMLAAKRVELAQRIAADQARLARVEQRLRYLEVEDAVSLDIAIKHVPALRVAQVRWRGEDGTAFDQLGEWVPGARRVLREALASAGVTATGPWFLHYELRPDGTLTPVLAAPIGAAGWPGSREVDVAELPAVDVVATVHRGRGGHDVVGPIYGQLARYAEAHGYQTDGPGRDHVIGRDGDDVVLELQLPVVPEVVTTV
jgi:DNA-binding transcriptional MerR regulator